MRVIESMNAAVEKHSLLQSKFYQAWSAGTLPVSALKTYAREYGAYISLVPAGWKVHGDVETAEVEIGHIELWRRFAEGLGTDIGEAGHADVAALVNYSQEAFSSPAKALGALYAFELQQPDTAKSKLEGLRAHYNLPEASALYFKVHTDDVEEVALLRERIERLSETDKLVAKESCEAACIALRRALDGLYETEAGDANKAECLM